MKPSHQRIWRRWFLLAATLALALIAGSPIGAVLGATSNPRPLPHVQFSEMMSETMLTAQAVALVEEGGRAIPLSVAYDGITHRALLLPHAALREGTWYTATLSAGVTDLAGNPLAASVVWRFRTVQTTTEVYLPLVLKH